MEYSKVLILLGALVLADSFPTTTTPIPILHQDLELNHDGTYKHSYETGNKIVVHESGHVKNAGDPENAIQVVEGQFSYLAPDGTPISVMYVADENGFRPRGAHLPVPPPAPFRK